MSTEKKGTITVTEPSKEFLKCIIRKEFDGLKISKDILILSDKAIIVSEKCIKVAEELGLSDLAEEMRNDLLTEKI